MLKINLKATTLTLLLIFLIPVPSYAKIERSQAAKDLFKQSHPCPSNGNNHGACHDYVIDHIKPLACGGADDPSNMQWQSTVDAKAKDKWERKDCQITSSLQHAQASTSGYITGPRGGCYELTASGKKHYVDRGLCH
jgi:hypothetical protein